MQCITVTIYFTASIVTYSIVAGNTYDAFVIRNFTGEIRVNNELDYENITSYSLDVRAFDGLYEDYAKVIINIENLNDNPPVFLANYTKTIEEEKLYEGCMVKVSFIWLPKWHSDKDFCLVSCFLHVDALNLLKLTYI